jgi:HSP20 family protein
MIPVRRGNGWLDTGAHQLHRFRNEFEHLFDRIVDDGAFLTQSWAGAPTSVWEDGDHVYVYVDLPGASRENVELTVHNGVLTIKGERKAPVGEDVKYLFNTRQFGASERSVKLSSSVDSSNVKAAFENGVLKIEIPKAEIAKPRKIEIQPV